MTRQEKAAQKRARRAAKTSASNYARANGEGRVPQPSRGIQWVKAGSTAGHRKVLASLAKVAGLMALARGAVR